MTSKFKVGTRVEITGCLGSGHGFAIGTEGIVVKTGTSSHTIKNSFGTQYGVYPSEMKVLPVTVEEIKTEIGLKQSQIDALQAQLDFMNETGSSEYSDTEFRTYQILKIMENKTLSKIEKSRLIAKLIDGE